MLKIILGLFIGISVITPALAEPAVWAPLFATDDYIVSLDEDSRKPVSAAGLEVKVKRVYKFGQVNGLVGYEIIDYFANCSFNTVLQPLQTAVYAPDGKLLFTQDVTDHTSYLETPKNSSTLLEAICNGD